MMLTTDDDLIVYLVPGDATSAEDAGVAFARALAGAPEPAFIGALAEQRNLVHGAIADAGHGASVAERSADGFEAGATREWWRTVALVHVVGTA
jgi:hypothetical protein